MIPIKYLVKLEGDHYWIEPHHKDLWFGFGHFQDALEWLENNAEPDVEDDRITIRKIFNEGLQVVWQFYGWHYEDDYGIGQSSYPRHGKPLYEELMIEIDGCEQL